MKKKEFLISPEERERIKHEEREFVLLKDVYQTPEQEPEAEEEKVNYLLFQSKYKVLIWDLIILVLMIIIVGTIKYIFFH